MINLKNSGLNLRYDNNNKLLLLNGEKIVPAIRRLKDIRNLVFDAMWLRNSDVETPIYYMFRGVCNTSEADIISKNHLRYDITVIPKFMLGQEYVKTYGHYHPEVLGTNVSYTEIYEILHGSAIVLMQKVKDSTVIDSYFVELSKGDIVIIPPNYGHITINNGDCDLVMSNWVCSEFKSEYVEIERMRGGAYFFVEGRTVKNRAYDNKNELRQVKSTDHSLISIKQGEPMYSLITKNSDALKFLTEPQKFGSLFEKVSQ